MADRLRATYLKETSRGKYYRDDIGAYAPLHGR